MLFLGIWAFGTGSPEFVVLISSALNRNSGAALGNVICSNICNIGLILGVAAVINPLAVKAEIVYFETPIIIVITGLLWLLIYDCELGRFDGIF